jgi:hypothetical protein
MQPQMVYLQVLQLRQDFGTCAEATAIKNRADR